MVWGQVKVADTGDHTEREGYILEELNTSVEESTVSKLQVI